jgi:hypothetical protein
VLDLEPIKAKLAIQSIAPPPWYDDEVRALIKEVERLNDVVAAMDREHAELIAFLVSVPLSMQCACGRTVTLDVGSD